MTHMMHILNKISNCNLLKLVNLTEGIEVDNLNYSGNYIEV